MSVDINLTTVNPGTGYSVSIVCKDATYLVDIHLLFTFFTPNLVNLDSNREVSLQKR